MGPSRLFHKNRSAHSLLNSQESEEREKEREKEKEKDRARFQPSPSDSPIHSPAYPPPSQYEDDEGNDELDPRFTQHHRQPEDARHYHYTQPARSQSQRGPGHINTNFQQPTINLVGPAHSTPSSAVDENAPDSFYRQASIPPPQPQKEDRKKRRFFGLGGSSKEPASSSSAKLGRSISVRRRDQYPDSTRYSVQQDWQSSHVSPTDEDDDEEDDEPDFQRSTVATNPPPPDREPLRSPGLPPAISRQDYSYQSSNTSPIQNRRSPLDRQGSHESPWARASSSVHHHTYSESNHQHTPSSYHPSPASATSALSGQPFTHKSPSETLQQAWQEQIPSRPSSQQSLEPPPIAQGPRSHEAHHVRSSSSQTSSISHYTQGSMIQPPPPQGPSRRPSEAQQESQINEQGRAGYQPYAQNTQDRNVLASNAPPPYSSQLAPSTQSYRNSQISTMQQQGNHEQGRSTPPPSRSRDDLSNIDYGQLQTKHEELQDKYRKVKKYYFDKDAQVQQLQNTLAHQRLSQSRTSLDDNEYTNRFSRLDGAINNLAFNLRREWRQIPPWLAPCVNRDACTTPTKEMTAVGRAAISRWLVDELFDRYFHPGLEPGLSAQLKIIEKNLRRLAPPALTDEEKELLLAKISGWRLATLDGLSELLTAPQAAANRTLLTEGLVEKLIASLCMMLKEPKPPGIETGVSMLVELAVNIAANLPLESRDVFVEYFTPGQATNEVTMKIDSGLPALLNPGENPAEGDTGITTSKQTEDTGSIDSREAASGNGNTAPDEKGEMSQQQAVAGKKKGMFGSFIGGGAGGKKSGPPSSIGQSIGAQGPPPGERKEERIKFSTFLCAQVRGRNVLVKAPVYVWD